MVRDIKTEIDQTMSLLPQTVAENTGGDGIVDGTAVDVKSQGAVLLQLFYGTIAAGVTGGNLKLIPMHGDTDSVLAQVGTDVVQYDFVEGTESGVLEYVYTGGKRYVAINADNSFTGGGAGTNTVVLSGVVVKSNQRYRGNTQFA